MQPRRARVRPRLWLPSGRGAVSIEMLLDELPRRPGQALAIVGGHGQGKTTTLGHLAALLPEGRLPQLLDEPSRQEAAAAARAGPLVYTAQCPMGLPQERVWRLAPWGADELVEYTLSVDPARARPVLPRALAMLEHEPLEGVPALWAAMLDLMLDDEGVRDLRSALDAALRPLGARARRRAGNAALKCVLGEQIMPQAGRGLPEPVARLLASEVVQRLIAAHTIVASLRNGGRASGLTRRLPLALVTECARGVTGPDRDRLLEVVSGAHRAKHAMAASILHAAGVEFLSRAAPRACLAGAYLEGLLAAGASLDRAQLHAAVLAGAEFSGAGLAGADLDAADLTRASLAGATLERARLRSAVLRGADLSGARARLASFAGARLDGANLEDLEGVGCDLNHASLQGARLVRADLSEAKLVGADLLDADCSGARFDRATLERLDLRSTALSGASFNSARISSCDLSGLSLPAAAFRGAVCACTDLTGSVMPNADFTGAVLSGSGLAEVHWEGASLRGANLRGSTFHMGSSRSGLIFSPIASEGSRTGFYSEDLGDLTHKRPEEIRKANLRGADLRGAGLQGVDFYLVDLREARYDPGMERWFRRCGAILEDPE